MRLSFKTILLTSAIFSVTSAWAANPIVDVDTTMGDFKLELYPKEAPKTVENFLKYVKDGSYVGTQFHRVIAGFMIQGGGFDKDFRQLPTDDPIINESKLSNKTATISMARTSDPNSATRQFFINVNDNLSLDAKFNQPGYAVFGKVIEGYDVVEKISKVKTGINPLKRMADVPEKPIIIEKMVIQNQ